MSSKGENTSCGSKRASEFGRNEGLILGLSWVFCFIKDGSSSLRLVELTAAIIWKSRIKVDWRAANSGVGHRFVLRYLDLLKVVSFNKSHFDTIFFLEQCAPQLFNWYQIRIVLIGRVGLLVLIVLLWSFTDFQVFLNFLLLTDSILFV